MTDASDLAAILRILRDLDVSVSHFNRDNTAFVGINGYTTVSAGDARVLRRLTS